MLREHFPSALVAVEELGVGFKVSARSPTASSTASREVVSFEELMATPVTRVTLRDPTSTSEEFLERTARIGLHGVEYAVGWSAWLDINPEGVSKGAALEAIRAGSGVEPQHTVAVGDQRNDLEMLRWAARGRGDGQRPGRGQGRGRRGDRRRRRRRARDGAALPPLSAPRGRRPPVRRGNNVGTERATASPPVKGVRWTAPTSPPPRAGRRPPARRVGRPPRLRDVGLIHLLIAWIALKVAWGSAAGRKRRHLRGPGDGGRQSGTGVVLLWSPSSGSCCWPCGSCRGGARPRRDGDRLKAAAKGVTYLFFAWTTFKVGQGRAPRPRADQGLHRRPDGQPRGRVLVGVVGLVVLGIAGYHVYKGWTKKFLKDLREHPGDWAVTAGRVGYIAKGVALFIVGFFFLVAAWQAAPEGHGPGRGAADE